NLTYQNDSILIENGIGVDISALATDVELSTEAANRIAGDAALSTRIANDSTALITHIAADLDLSVTNELVDSASLSGNNLNIYQAGSTTPVIADLSSLSGTEDSTRIRLDNNRIY